MDSHSLVPRLPRLPWEQAKAEALWRLSADLKVQVGFLTAALNLLEDSARGHLPPREETQAAHALEIARASVAQLRLMTGSADALQFCEKLASEG